MSSDTYTMNIVGPPGTGKTRNLIALFAIGVKQYGSERVAAVTYTRAAGNELKQRLGPLLGVRDDERALGQAMPYVGTIHAIAYRMLGRPTIVDAKAFKRFISEAHVVAEQKSEYGDTAESVEGLSYDLDMLENADEAESLRVIYGAARHRMESLEDAYARLPLDWHGLGLERLRFLITRYEAWKQREHLLDFEDLLVYGAELIPPIDMLICDEVQDNSKLMWYVIDRWSQHCKQSIAAGDPFQSIYLFSGADPQLYLSRSGQRVLLTESHRLSSEAVRVANRILSESGHEADDIIGKWYGQPVGTAQDGKEAHLARTHRLLGQARAKLLLDGTPFVELRGVSPWDSVDGQAYRTLTKLIYGDMVGRAGFHSVCRALRARFERGKLQHILSDKDPNPVGPGEASLLLGDLGEARKQTRYFDYLQRVEHRNLLWTHPRVSLGTIHASKGKEFDTVNLIRSWAFRPAQNLETPEGRRGEACVAYVGATRHRVALNLIPVEEGIEYPWPA